MRLLTICMLLLVISGCASNRYNQRLAEIEGAYAMKQISTAEYLSLKNDVNQERKLGFIAASVARR